MPEVNDQLMSWQIIVEPAWCGIKMRDLDLVVMSSCLMSLSHVDSQNSKPAEVLVGVVPSAGLMWPPWPSCIFLIPSLPGNVLTMHVTVLALLTHSS